MQAAIALEHILEECVNQNTKLSWRNLLLFAYTSFRAPEKSERKKTSLAAIVKENLLSERQQSPPIDRQTYPRQRDPEHQLRNAVEGKIIEGNIAGAVRLLTSEDSVAPVNDETLEILRLKHPPSIEHASFPEKILLPPVIPVVTEDEVRIAIMSFPNGSAGGIDGLKPQHLKDLINPTGAEAASKLCSTLAKFVCFVLKGNIPEEIRPIFFGATLTALKKSDGGIRPIAVGNSLRRVVCKIVSHRVADPMGNLFRPIQLGFGTRGGAEAAVHAARYFASDRSEPNRVIVKLDFRNAFNTPRRDHLLEEVKSVLPEYFDFISQMYRLPSNLFYGSHLLESACGVQQGDPLGPLLFCLVIHKLTRRITSPLNVWYLDDCTIGGPVNTVLADLALIKEEIEKVGLELNTSKCELFCCSSSQSQELFDQVSAACPGVRMQTEDDLVLLGSPMFGNAVKKTIEEKKCDLERMISRLQLLSAHHALFLLKNCLSIPKLLYVLRTSPAWAAASDLRMFDDAIRNGLRILTNNRLEDSAWTQATLPVRQGGLGIRRTEQLSYSAYLASVYSVTPLVSGILRDFDQEEVVTEPIFHWSEIAKVNAPAVNERSSQKSWDSPINEHVLRELIADSTEANRARLLAVSTPESGAWLEALPSAALGNHLNDDALRISVALRLGIDICQPHQCRCGSQVDSKGHHGLKCSFSAGRHSRHGALNSIVQKALSSAGYHAIREPPGLNRGDGNRPDGMTLHAWKEGKELVWDVTVVDTMAPSHVRRSSQQAGSAAQEAEQEKIRFYSEIGERYFFCPIGMETMGSWGPEALAIIGEIGRKLIFNTNV